MEDETMHKMARSDPRWRYCVRELSIFGSAARGEMRPDSDIDTLVEGVPGAGIDLMVYTGNRSSEILCPVRRGSCMRHDDLYLTDIVEAADHIAQLISGTG